MHTLLVVLGGGLGAGARYGLQGLVYRIAGTTFPYGTLVVNVIGSFLIGLLMTLFAERFLAAPGLRLFLTVGVLGGFTTFSSFSYETVALVRDGSMLLAVANIAGNVGICLLATWAGLMAGRLL